MNPIFSALGRNYPDITPCLDSIENAYAIMERSFAEGHKLLVCGNGGSAADSEHLVADLMYGFLLKRALS